MKKERILVGIFIILLVGGVIASDIFDVGLEVRGDSINDEGFLQNTKEFLFGWLVEGVFMNDVVDYGEKLVCEEECGICEKCIFLEEYPIIYGIPEDNFPSEKMNFDDVKFTLSLINLLSRTIQDLAIDIILQESNSNLVNPLLIATMSPGLLTQIRNPQGGSAVEDPLSEDTIWVPIPNLFNFFKKHPSPKYKKPTCMSDAECEKEKKICPEYSNKKLVDLYCNPQKYPEKYSCSYEDGGLCRTNNFIIESLNGIDENTAVQECCQWAWKLEYEKCKQETDLGIKEFGKYSLKGGDYDGRKLTGKVTLNIQGGGNSGSNSVHSGWNNIITLTGSRDEIAKDLIPGDVASFIVNKGFVSESPPWLYKGLSYTFASKSQKCEYFKELVKMKNNPDFSLKEILGEENPGAINEIQSLGGFSFIEFLMSRGSRYSEKNVHYQKFMLNFVFNAIQLKKSGDRTWHSWENALKDSEYSYGIDSIENAEGEWRAWINSQLGPNGEIYAEEVINPCTCILREEYEKQ